MNSKHLFNNNDIFFLYRGNKIDNESNESVKNVFQADNGSNIILVADINEIIQYDDNEKK